MIKYYTNLTRSKVRFSCKAVIWKAQLINPAVSLIQDWHFFRFCRAILVDSKWLLLGQLDTPRSPSDTIGFVFMLNLHSLCQFGKPDWNHFDNISVGELTPKVDSWTLLKDILFLCCYYYYLMVSLGSIFVCVELRAVNRVGIEFDLIRFGLAEASGWENAAGVNRESVSGARASSPRRAYNLSRYTRHHSSP